MVAQPQLLGLALGNCVALAYSHIEAATAWQRERPAGRGRGVVIVFAGRKA